MPTPETSQISNTFVTRRQRCQRRSVKRAAPPHEPDFVGSEIHTRIRDLLQSGIRVPIWCMLVTGNARDAIVLAQLVYWFSPTEKATSIRRKRPRGAVYVTEMQDGMPVKRYFVPKSGAGLAGECCLDEDQVRRALESLVSAGILIRVNRKEILRAQGTDITGRNVLPYCYRFCPAALHARISRFMVNRGILRAVTNERGEEVPVAWRSIEDYVLCRAATQHRKIPGQNPHLVLNFEWNASYVPAFGEEFVGSQLQVVLSLGAFFFLPKWCIRVARTPSQAILLARLYGWQSKLTLKHNQHEDLLWLKKSHHQLAEETGLWPDRPSSTRFVKLAKAIKGLKSSGLIEVIPARGAKRGMVSRFRLLPVGLEAALRHIDPDDMSED